MISPALLGYVLAQCTRFACGCPVRGRGGGGYWPGERRCPFSMQMSAPAGEPPLPPDLRAPDDARDLDGDLRALQQERRAVARARRRSRRRTSPSWPLLALTALSVACAVAVAQLFMVRERPRQLVAQAPLRSAPAGLTGQPGGLLPDVRLIRRDGPISARELRPAVLLVVASRCECTDKVRHVVAQTAGHPVQLYLVGDRSDVTALAGVAGGAVVGLADDGGALSRAYLGQADAAVVLVRANGLVSEIIGGIATSLQLDPAIRRMLDPTRS
jgi:hypothetical protein